MTVRTSEFQTRASQNSRIDHIDVKVDDKTATICNDDLVLQRDEAGGGLDPVSINGTCLIGSNYVVKSATGHVDVPKFNADIVSAFSDYKIQRIGGF
jgi:hypothetical protein